MKRINHVRRNLAQVKKVLAQYEDPQKAFDETWRELMVKKLKDQIRRLDAELVAERIKEDQELDQREQARSKKKK
jgi:ribosomal protein L29